MESQKLTIELTIQQWDIVAAALGELPLKASLDVFMAIRAQADAALKPQQSQTE